MAKNKKNSEDQTGTHTVIASFRDRDDFSKVYEVGDDVSDFDEKRLSDLVELKLVSDNTES